jgi:hypothetical protein
MSIKELPASAQLADFYLTKSQRYSHYAVKADQEGKTSQVATLEKMAAVYRNRAQLILS